jgi:hypothetical protein
MVQQNELQHNPGSFEQGSEGRAESREQRAESRPKMESTLDHRDQQEAGRAK